MHDTAPPRRRLRATSLISAAAVVVALLAGCTTTGAAYRDQTHARTESLETAPIPPFQVGLARNSRMVDTGLGLASTGDVYVWGRTTSQINGGAPDPGTSRAPQRVPLPEGEIRQVTGGIYNVNAVDTQGTVWGWGSLPARDGTNAAKPNGNPQQIRIGTAWNGTGPVLDEIVAISSTEFAGAAIRGDGTIWHWGENTGYGGTSTPGASQLMGLPDPSIEGNRPVYLKGAYTNFYLMLENGDVWYWGGTGGNSLPSDLGNTASTPQMVTALAPWMKSNVAPDDPYIVAVDGGINMGGALLSDGQVLTWGSRDSRIGGRPVSSNDEARIPAVHPTLSGIVSMQYGFTGAAMIDADNNLWGYGATDDYGRFPDSPAMIDTGIAQYAAGQGYFIWQKTDGTFWARGYNPAGALGTPIGTLRETRQITSMDLGVVAK